MAKNAFHASKGIGGTPSIMAANVVRTSAAMSSIFPPFDSGARRGAALTLVEFRVNASARYHFITTLTIAVILTAMVTKRIHATSRRNFMAQRREAGLPSISPAGRVIIQQSIALAAKLPLAYGQGFFVARGVLLSGASGGALAYSSSLKAPLGWPAPVQGHAARRLRHRADNGAGIFAAGNAEMLR
jgi:hypothetical protein